MANNIINMTTSREDYQYYKGLAVGLCLGISIGLFIGVFI